MKYTLKFISIILATFLLPMLTTFFFDVKWFTMYWFREVLLLLFIFLQLAIGFATLWNAIKKYGGL